MRTHGLVQSTELLRLTAVDFNIEIDCSLFMPRVAELKPHRLTLDDEGANLIRIPYFWEDDLACYEDDQNWLLEKQEIKSAGLKVFDFHPIHIYLNSGTMVPYEKTKVLGRLSELEPSDIDPFVNTETLGVGTFFR